MSQILKRYARMVRPLMFFKGRKENLQSHRQPYSFSGDLSWRNKQELRGRRGGYSAPASMRTSPTNSGLLLATTTLPSSTSDSTMEELQAAIQAAIAHCKNSIATEEKIKC
uniref:BRI1 kinase inhibitor 1 n=2 Tax=Salix TaxID=40685 RepID=A0A6N2MIV3_SALVM